jgi:hypothetical protein
MTDRWQDEQLNYSDCAPFPHCLHANVDHAVLCYCILDGKHRGLQQPHHQCQQLRWLLWWHACNKRSEIILSSISHVGAGCCRYFLALPFLMPPGFPIHTFPLVILHGCKQYFDLQHRSSSHASAIKSFLTPFCCVYHDASVLHYLILSEVCHSLILIANSWLIHDTCRWPCFKLVNTMYQGFLTINPPPHVSHALNIISQHSESLHCVKHYVHLVRWECILFIVSTRATNLSA